MSKIIKRKVGLILPCDGGAMMLFYPPDHDDGYLRKTFHWVPWEVIKSFGIVEGDNVAFKMAESDKEDDKLLGVYLKARCHEPCELLTAVQPVPTEPKKLNMRERINLARSAITGLNIRSAKKLFDDALLAAQAEAKIPAPEGSGNDGEKRVDAGSC